MTRWKLGHVAAACYNGQELSQQQPNDLIDQANDVARRRSTERRSMSEQSGNDDQNASDELNQPHTHAHSESLSGRDVALAESGGISFSHQCKASRNDILVLFRFPCNYFVANATKASHGGRRVPADREAQKNDSLSSLPSTVRNE